MKHGKLPCGNYAVHGTNRCRFHQGSAGPPIQHGRRADLVVKKFGAWVRDLMLPEEVRTFDPDVALYDVRMKELLERMEAGDAPEWRKNLLHLAEQFQAANEARNDPSRFVRALATIWPALLERIRSGAKHDQAWSALLTNRDARANIATQAVNAHVRQQRAVTERDMIVLFGRMVDMVEAEVGVEYAARVIERWRSEVARWVGGGSWEVDGAELSGEGASPPAALYPSGDELPDDRA